MATWVGAASSSAERTLHAAGITNARMKSITIRTLVEEWLCIDNTVGFRPE
jgi:hypothetical protein